MNRLILYFIAILIFSSCSDKLEKIRLENDEGVLIEEYSIDTDSLIQGEFLRYDANGILERANYTNGKLHGKRLLYYADGKVEIEEIYHNDILDGSFKEYYSSGSPRLETTYTRGMLQDKLKVYFENGNLKEETTFVDNEENGPFTEYFENGNIAWRGTYKNGDNEIDSLYEYKPNGELYKVKFCDNSSICKTVRTYE